MRRVFRWSLVLTVVALVLFGSAGCKDNSSNSDLKVPEVPPSKRGKDAGPIKPPGK